MHLTGEYVSDAAAAGKGGARAPLPPPPPTVPATGCVRAPGEALRAPAMAAGGGGGAGGADGWSVGEVCALIADCGFDPAGARAAGTDGGALVEMVCCGAGRDALQLPVEEGGLGLTAAQVFRLRSALRARGVVLPPLK